MFRLNTTCFMFLGLLMLFFGSCSPEIDSQKHINVAKEVLAVQKAFNQSYKTIAWQMHLEDELIQGYSNQLIVQGCATSEFTPDSIQFFPAKLDINFSSDCKLKDELFNGDISVVIDGYMNQAGSNAIISFEDFSINGSNLVADYTFKNKGNSEQQLPVIEHQIVNGEFQNSFLGNSNYSASIFSTQIVGHQSSIENEGSTAFEDDVWEHNFSGTFVSSTGAIYNLQSETNLTDHWNCNLPSAGRMVIEGEDLQTNIIIDFGDGTCDQKFTVELDGENSEHIIE